MDAFEKEFKLPNLIDDGDYEKIDQLLDEVSWMTLPAREKRIVLDNIWKSCEDGLLTHTKTETTADMKAEFYDKYYDRIVEWQELIKKISAENKEVWKQRTWAWLF